MKNKIYSFKYVENKNKINLPAYLVNKFKNIILI